MNTQQISSVTDLNFTRYSDNGKNVIFSRDVSPPFAVDGASPFPGSCVEKKTFFFVSCINISQKKLNVSLSQ